MLARFAKAALMAAMVMTASPALAVQPDEVLADPVLESRARELSKGLRCLVCRNESIDESHAELARDLRLLVRERLVAGDSDAEALEFIVDRYGEYVLLSPPATGSSLILWYAPVGLAVIGLATAVIYLRRRRPVDEVEAPSALSDSEKARLDALMKEDL